MSNFIVEFKKGQNGDNIGIPFGPGLETLTSAINGTQRQRLYILAAAPKAGKSTLCDYAFVVQPYLHSLKNAELEIEIHYFSFEIDRISKEFEMAAHFLNRDYGVSTIPLNGTTVRGQPFVDLSPDFLRGRIQDDKEKLIPVPIDIQEKLKLVYQNRIVPMFGKYDNKGIQIKKGLITMITNKDNPTGVYKYYQSVAENNGEFITEQHGPSTRLVSYVPKNPKKYVIFVMDHLRKLLPERDATETKQIVDRMLSYQVQMRNLTGFTFVDIIHMNRSLSNLERLKQFQDMIYPDSDMIKDSGNGSEEADYVLTIFNPNDDRFNLEKHFGLVIKDKSKNILYPDLRTIHLVESRHSVFPQHFRVNMKGNLKTFYKFKK